jgi:uncharacterized protein YecT (DUF1311 family)
VKGYPDSRKADSHLRFSITKQELKNVHRTFSAVAILDEYRIIPARSPTNTPATIHPANSPQPQPCSDAKTQLAINECFAKLYETADAELNIAYNKVVAFMKHNLTDAQQKSDEPRITHNQSALDKLLAAQRAWLAYRDAHCDSVKFQYEGGSLQPTIWSQCMAETTQQRITALTTAYDLSN